MESRIVGYLLYQRMIGDEQKEIVQYGIGQILSVLYIVAAEIVIGGLFGKLLEIVLYTIVFFSIRKYAGGYHARTKTSCYIKSVMMILICVICMKYIYIKDWIMWILMLSTTVYITRNAPVQSANKPLSEKEIKIYHRRTCRNCVIWIAVAFPCWVLGREGILGAIILAYMCVMGLLFFGRCFKNV